MTIHCGTSLAVGKNPDVGPRDHTQVIERRSHWMKKQYRPNFAPADNLYQCPAPTPTPHVDFGVEYSVNIIIEFSKPGLQINTATTYWNLSTWNP